MLVLAAPEVSAADDTVPGPLSADLIRVIDGDTIEVRAHLWLGLELTTHIRLANINAPELHGGCPAERHLARLARDFVHLTLTPAVVLRDVRQDKYGGRAIATVFDRSGRDLGALLLQARLAVPFGARPSWCE